MNIRLRGMTLRDMSFFFNRKDADAQKLIYEIYYKMVYKTAFFVTREHESAQDILQDTFIKAFKSLHKVEDHDKIKSWLATITTRTAIDYCRKQGKVTIHELNEEITTDYSPSAEDAVVTMWTNNILWSTVRSLDYITSSILVLKFVHGFKDEEVALHLDMSVGTVKSRIHRAKQKLKDELEQKLGGEGGGLLGRGAT